MKLIAAAARLIVLGSLAAAIWSVGAAGVLSAQEPPGGPSAEPSPPERPPPPPHKHPKFASSIVEFLEATRRLPEGQPATNDNVSTAHPPAGALLKTGLLRLDSQGRVQVYIRVTDNSLTAINQLEQLGVVVEGWSADWALMQARVPLKRLSQLAENGNVAAVTPPDYGHVNVGSRLTQGDALLGFDDLRASFGVDGTGVTVGVISDGIAGLASAIASSDLPNSTLNRVGGKLISTIGGVIATSFRADGDLEAGLDSGIGAEGTAILEIVHDIAPGAQLRFANFSTSFEFISAVNYLAANSDVVIDDIGFFGGPYDQSSAISVNTADALNKPSNSIRGYYTSVGNQALRHYQEKYVNSGQDGTTLVGQPGSFHQFAATIDTTDCLGLGPTTANRIRLGAGANSTIFLSWDDTFGAVTTDYDLYVVDSGTVVSSGGVDNNRATLAPIEVVAVTNSSGVQKSYDILIQNFENTSLAHNFDMFVFGGIPCSGIGSVFNYNTRRSSVPAQSDAGGGVVSVGAINSSDPGTDTIASYSSRGPTNNGAVKPDVTAIDGVSVTGFGGFPSTFFGTSAAAPHVAGLAALLLELRPDLLSGEPGDNPAADRVALRDGIMSTAFDLGFAGVDNTFGSGRVRGLTAGQALAAPTPTPTPVPTPAPTPVPSASTLGLLALAAILGLLVALGRRRTSSFGSPT